MGRYYLFAQGNNVHNRRLERAEINVRGGLYMMNFSEFDHGVRMAEQKFERS
ncbi:hypothetical protein D3C73_1606100 [compost metagenome]